MSKELIIQTKGQEREIALIQDKKLMELHSEELVSDGYQVGDIYLGRIRKLMPGLNAAFVDIGWEKEGFLHYHDLGPDLLSLLDFTDKVLRTSPQDETLKEFPFKPQIIKTGKVEEVLQGGVPIMVQIVKEPISTKGHRLTSALSISGRYCIMMPFANSMTVSKKIESKEEKARLKSIATKYRPNNHGIIIRTVAEGVEENDIKEDIARLMAIWVQTVENLKQRKPVLYTESTKSLSLIRDIFNDSFEKIIVDDEKLYQDLKQYFGFLHSDKMNIVKLHKDEEKLSFEAYEVDKQIRGLFNKIINIGNGAYLVIEHTEAMHVIDVNTGSKRIKSEDQEATAIKTNMEAASEIARQLRLRDLGGIIMVDFIDMRNPVNRKTLYDHIKLVMKDDRAKHTILPLTKFGILQITRQRVRQETSPTEQVNCPLCHGTGSFMQEVPIHEDIEARLIIKIKSMPISNFTLKLNPYLASYFTKGIWSKRWQWFIKYRKWIKIEEVPSTNPYDYELMVN